MASVSTSTVPTGEVHKLTYKCRLEDGYPEITSDNIEYLKTSFLKSADSHHLSCRFKDVDIEGDRITFTFEETLDPKDPLYMTLNDLSNEIYECFVHEIRESDSFALPLSEGDAYHVLNVDSVPINV